MNYLQIGALCIVGLIAVVVWWTCFVGLNKDVTYHNKRTRGPYALPRRKKRGKPLRGGTDSVLQPRQQQPELQRQTMPGNSRTSKNSLQGGPTSRRPQSGMDAKKTTAKRPPRGR